MTLGLPTVIMKPKKALEFYKKALKAYKHMYEDNDERIATVLINIGIINTKLKLEAQAFENFNKALTVLEKKHGKDHPTQAFVI